MCELISDDLLKVIPNINETKKDPNPICYIKLFTTDLIWTWYIIELNKEDNSSCYGYIESFNTYLGYFSLDDIKSLKSSSNFDIQRDESFMPSALLSLKKLNAIKRICI